MTLKKLSLIIVLLYTSFSVNAALVNRGNGMLYDDVLDITWITDASLARNTHYDTLDWWVASQWADDLVYGGYTDWRLPSMDLNGDGIIVDCIPLISTEVTCRDNEYAYLFRQYDISLDTPGDFINIGDLHYWSRTENPVYPSLAYLYNLESGFQGTTSKITINRNALAVRDGDVTAVPNPAAAWLFISGICCLFGFSSRKRNN